MTHHPRNVLLRISVKGSSFRTYFANVFMVLFAMRFLPGTHGIAIINTSPDPGILPTFQCVRILEFATPVCEDQGERGGKGSSPYGMFDGIKNSFHMTGLFAVHKVSHHTADRRYLESYTIWLESVRLNSALAWNLLFHSSPLFGTGIPIDKWNDMIYHMYIHMNIQNGGNIDGCKICGACGRHAE